MTLIDGCPQETIAADDRGLLYGDGLFETIRCIDGEPRLWREHLARLRHGCMQIKIPFDIPDSVLLEEAKTAVGAESGVLRLTVTRGSGPRGYRSPVISRPRRIMQFSPLGASSNADRRSKAARATLCHTRLAHQPMLAGLKHLNRLEQVVARSEWADEYFEGFMQDQAGNLVEGTMSNLFLVKQGVLTTPELSRCGVEGVMRGLVMAQARSLGIDVSVAAVTLKDAEQADGIFVTNSLLGIVPVHEFRGRTYSVPAVVPDLQRYLEGQW